MSSIEHPVEIDGDKLQQFVFRAVDEVRRRPPLNARLVMMGDKLDLYPNSTCVGSDYHHGSIETARRRAKEAGVADRVRFQIEPAAAYSGSGYDLVTMFDCCVTWATRSGPPAIRKVRRTQRLPGRLASRLRSSS